MPSLTTPAAGITAFNIPYADTLNPFLHQHLLSPRSGHRSELFSVGSHTGSCEAARPRQAAACALGLGLAPPPSTAPLPSAPAAPEGPLARACGAQSGQKPLSQAGSGGFRINLKAGVSGGVGPSAARAHGPCPRHRHLPSRQTPPCSLLAAPGPGQSRGPARPWTPPGTGRPRGRVPLRGRPRAGGEARGPVPSPPSPPLRGGFAPPPPRPPRGGPALPPSPRGARLRPARSGCTNSSRRGGGRGKEGGRPR